MTGDGWESWELSVKRYRLAGDDPSSPKSWIGPNGRETPDKKYEHLKNHQLALAQSPIAQEALRTKGIEHVTKARAWVCGRLFWPLERYQEERGVPPHLQLPREDEFLSCGYSIQRANLERIDIFQGLPSSARAEAQFLVLGRTSLFAPRRYPRQMRTLALDELPLQQTPKQGAEVALLLPVGAELIEARRLWLLG